MWTNTQLAYLAGIIDGEGTFYISNGDHRHRILVVNTDEILIKWLQDNFGGLVYKRTSKAHPNWKMKYEWLICKTDITILCEALLPFLICKKRQAEVMLKLRKTFYQRKRGAQRVPEELREIRNQCKEEMTKLNHRSSLS
jgi:hypothetical protein